MILVFLDLSMAILRRTALDGYQIHCMRLTLLCRFQEKFGTQPGPGGVGKVISADWQTKISNASLAGQIIGLLINGWMSERFGYRMTMLLTQVVMVISIFIPFFAPNIQTILAGYIILGLPWGVFQTLSVTYASEVAPVVL